jgi:hypothetical protein
MGTSYHHTRDVFEHTESYFRKVTHSPGLLLIQLSLVHRVMFLRNTTYLITELILCLRTKKGMKDKMISVELL